jgi:iron complex outermembrane receptor protein
VVQPPPYILVRFPYANAISGHTDGFEIAPDWQARPWWRLGGSYSYLQMNLRNNPGDVDVNAVARYEGSSPRHQLFVRSSFSLGRDIDIDPAYRYVSRLPARSAASYHTASIRVAWRPTSALELSLTGQNLLQAHHVEFNHSPGPSPEIRRGVYAAVSWRRR